MTERRGWEISEADARARDIAALEQFRNVYRREIVDGMPDTVIMFRLARHGYSAAEVKRLDQIMSRLECQS